MKEKGQLFEYIERANKILDYLACGGEITTEIDRDIFTLDIDILEEYGKISVKRTNFFDPLISKGFSEFESLREIMELVRGETDKNIEDDCLQEYQESQQKDKNLEENKDSEHERFIKEQRKLTMTRSRKLWSDIVAQLYSQLKIYTNGAQLYNIVLADIDKKKNNMSQNEIKEQFAKFGINTEFEFEGNKIQCFNIGDIDIKEMYIVYDYKDDTFKLMYKDSEVLRNIDFGYCMLMVLNYLGERDLERRLYEFETKEKNFNNLEYRGMQVDIDSHEIDNSSKNDQRDDEEER